MNLLKSILRYFNEDKLSSAYITRSEVSKLNVLDTKRKVFGSSSHKYRLTRVSPKELDEFETWCGITLPASYRSHLLDIGYGAGPDYGLMSPKHIISEMKTLLNYWDTDLGSPPKTGDIFQLETATDLEPSDHSEPWITSTWPLSGCIPISDQGCTYCSVLQITGDNAGAVWDVANDVGCEGLWLPSGKDSQATEPLHFNQWFLDWIQQSKKELTSTKTST